MSSYLVSPPDHTDWREDPVAFALALKARWPEAVIREDPPASTMVLSFSFVEQGVIILGDLHRDGQALSMDADVAIAAAIATWWRARVPGDIALVFYDEGYDADVPVHPGADPTALAAAYLFAANA